LNLLRLPEYFSGMENGDRKEIILFKFLFVSSYFLLLFLVLFFGMRITWMLGEYGFT